MYRVELKEKPINTSPYFQFSFLMYRVELKEITLDYDEDKELIEEVPNVPCGVESKENLFSLQQVEIVPNVPCGIERNLIFRIVPRMRTDS